MSQYDDDYFKLLREWSFWKHEILSKYLEKMTGILQRRETIFYVDGFAGKGTYEETELPGSPLRAARIARNLQENPRRKYSLRCINIEPEDEYFANLVEVTAGYSDLVKNYHGMFSEHVRRVIDDTQEKPALFFLDPFGLKGLEWEDLVPVLERGQEPASNELTELLIRFDAQMALRLAGFGSKEGEAHLQRVLKNLGVESIRVIHEALAPCADRPSCRRERITELYQSQLRKYYDYVLRIPIRTRTEHFKYYLVFATRHIRGVTAMNDALYEVTGLRDEAIQTWRSEHGLPAQLGMFDKSEDDALLAELEILKNVIPVALKENNGVKRVELRGRVALIANNFGRFSASHFTAVLGGRSHHIREGTGLKKDSIVPLGKDVVEVKGKPGSPDAMITLRNI
jgi:three-Cys-motif partner protein